MVEMFTYTNPGGRPENEDSIGSMQKDDMACVLVADGLGGHGGGAIASSAASEVILKAFEENGDMDQEWVDSLFQSVNQIVLDKQTSHCKMKTTCAVLFLKGEKACWAHLGDSRLYHFVNGKIAHITDDHSVSQLAVLSGEITRDQIRFHEDRNRVLRSFGVEGTVKPTICETTLEPGVFHAFLLCSDGFWEYVLEAEMESTLKRVMRWSSRPDKWIKAMRKILEKKVDGTNDNYSAAALFYLE